MNEIEFENGTFGTKATITARWHDSLLRSLLEQDIRELELNLGKGWRGKTIEFLRALPQLRSLTILDQTLDSIEPIHYLQGLVELHLSTYSDVPVDFNAFPKLTECWFDWIKGSDSLFECKPLKRLGLDNYKKKSSEPFSNLIDLEKLTLLNAGVEELIGIFNLTNLTHLSLANLRKVTSLNGIQNLKNLEVLEIQRCKAINSVSEIFGLSKLKRLLLIDLGTIESIRGIENLTELEEFLFYESTNIIDGDISPVLALKKLNSISFQNRRHYTHKRESFGELYYGLK